MIEPASVEDTMKRARKMARSHRRILRMPVRTSLPRGTLFSHRDIVLHEAAHCVVTIALKGEVLFAHIGNTIGGTILSYGEYDGIVGAVNLPMNDGIYAVAGIVQNGFNWIGLGDAVVLSRYIGSQLGPCCCGSEPELVDRLVAESKERARSILKLHKKAIGPVADLLSTGTQFDGRAIRETAERYSPSIPSANRLIAGMAADWRRALTGNARALETVRQGGFSEILDLVIAERRATAGQPRTITPPPDAAP